jgi:hypothetical protein
VPMAGSGRAARGHLYVARWFAQRPHPGPAPSCTGIPKQGASATARRRRSCPPLTTPHPGLPTSPSDSMLSTTGPSGGRRPGHPCPARRTRKRCAALSPATDNAFRRVKFRCCQAAGRPMASRNASILSTQARPSASLCDVDCCYGEPLQPGRGLTCPSRTAKLPSCGVWRG